MTDIGTVVNTMARRLVDAVEGARGTLRGLRSEAAATLKRSFSGLEAETRRIVARSYDLGEEEFPGPAREGPFRPADAGVAGWETKVWDCWGAAGKGIGIEAESPPRLFRIGTLSDSLTIDAEGTRERFSVPALASLFLGRNLMIVGEGPVLKEAQATVEAVLLRALAGSKPGRLNLTLVDSLGLGRNLALLTQFAETIRGPKVWHDPKEIEEALLGLTARMAEVVQKNLRNEFEDLDAYNRTADVKEAYRILAIANFPVGFGENATVQLNRILEGGNRTGIGVVMTVDSRLPLPYKTNLEDLKRTCLVIEARAGGFRYAVPGLDKAVLALDAVPPERDTIAQEIAARINKPALDARAVRVDFTTFVDRPLWAKSTRDSIAVKVGRRGARDAQSFELGREDGEKPVHHALLGGRTGSGKSVLLNVLITNLCLAYPPDELELYLIDFKQGVEFEVFRSLPHARVVALQSEREFGLSVLRGLTDEILRRSELTKKVEAKDLRSYRQLSGEKLPRILLVIDEFQMFFERQDKLAAEARQHFSQISKQGRAFGIHMVLASQTIGSSDGGDLDPGTLSQLGLRIALMMNEGDSYKVLGKDNVAARDLRRPGEAIYNAGGGRPQDNESFQVAFLTTEVLQKSLDEVSALAHERLGAGYRRPRIFRGNRSGDITHNKDLANFLVTRPAKAVSRPRLFLGEPVSLEDTHTGFHLRAQSGANLLLVGQEEVSALSTFLSCVLSWAAQRSPGTGKLFAAALVNEAALPVSPDTAAEDDPRANPLVLLDRSGPVVERGSGALDMGRMIRTVAQLLGERQKRVEAGEKPHLEPVLLGLFGIQRAKKLYREGAVPAETKELTRILSDGPELGINTVIWADTYFGLMKVLESRDLNYLDGRVAFQGADSGKILGDHATGFSIRSRYGVLYETELPSELKKFQCYNLVQLTDWAGELLTRRG